MHDYDDKKNNDLSFYHNFYDTNENFCHSKIFKIYIILNNYYVYIDIVIVKHNFKIWSKLHYIPIPIFFHNYFFLGSLWCTNVYLLFFSFLIFLNVWNCILLNNYMVFMKKIFSHVFLSMKTFSHVVICMVAKIWLGTKTWHVWLHD